MRRIIMEFDKVSLTATLRDTPTAEALWNALPFKAAARTWGDEVYFETPVSMPREADSRTVIAAGELAFWNDGMRLRSASARRLSAGGTKYASPARPTSSPTLPTMSDACLWCARASA